MTFDQVMENLTDMEQRIIEDEIERRVSDASYYEYQSGYDSGYESGYDSGHDAAQET